MSKASGLPFRVPLLEFLVIGDSSDVVIDDIVGFLIVEVVFILLWLLFQKRLILKVTVLKLAGHVFLIFTNPNFLTHVQSL